MNALEELKKRNRWIFYEDAVEEWRWRVEDANGKVLFNSSEGYARLNDAKQCAIRAGWVFGESHTVGG